MDMPPHPPVIKLENLQKDSNNNKKLSYGWKKVFRTMPIPPAPVLPE